MRHHNGIDVRVGDSISLHMEVDAASWSLFGHDQATPHGGTGHDPRDMFRSGNDGKLLQCSPVDVDLRVESIERVLGAFNLVPVDASVDDGYVNAAPCVGKTQFIDHKGIGVSFCPP